MHLHLDLVGGISGDMFISAVLDCYPELGAELPKQIALAGFPDLVRLESTPHNDGVILGHRFKVVPAEDASGHHHRHYSDIRQLIENSDLGAATKDIALGIFHIIAVAEAAIHDKPVEKVAFHEVGAWDSIADIICASYLIAEIEVKSCSCSSLPLGGGQVKTAHGMLPVPAPATALILEQFEFVDDGIAGERITPTGAAILKYLNPGQRPKARLRQQGFGFGTKVLPGISNTLRILVLEPTEQSAAPAASDWSTEVLQQIEFEIDDQTPEQLAAAIEQLQALPQVVDVLQYAAVGKKQRLSHAVRILSTGSPADMQELIARCFELTTTLGLRHSQVQRHLLPRQTLQVSHGDKDYPVKLTQRPGGDTVKPEMDALKDTRSLAEQTAIRQALEAKTVAPEVAPKKPEGQPDKAPS